MKSTMPVPSLRRDSASTSVEKRLLVLSSFSRATTATGSVALISAPNIRAYCQVQPEKSGMTRVSAITRRATVPIERQTPGTAIMVELAKVFRKVCRSSS